MDPTVDAYAIAGSRLMALIDAYRGAPGATAAGPLVAELEPEITAVAARLHAVPPLIEAEDIRQQVIMEVLEAARTMKLTERLAWVRRDLVCRATRETVRWLNSEARFPAAPFELLDPDTHGGPAELNGLPLDHEANVEIKPRGVAADNLSPDRQRSRRRAYEAARKRRWRARHRQRRLILEYNRRTTDGQPTVNRRLACPISRFQMDVK